MFFFIQNRVDLTWNDPSTTIIKAVVDLSRLYLMSVSLVTVE